MSRALERVADDFLELGKCRRLEQKCSAQLHRLGGGLRGAVAVIGSPAAWIALADAAPGVSRPVMPVMRTSHQHEVGLNLGISFKPSSPLAAVAARCPAESRSVDGISHVSSSSINSSLLIMPQDNGYGKRDRGFLIQSVKRLTEPMPSGEKWLEHETAVEQQRNKETKSDFKEVQVLAAVKPSTGR